MFTGNACLSLGLGCRDEWGKEVMREWTMGSIGDVGTGEGRLHLVFCYNMKDRTEGLGNKEGREGLQAAYLVFCQAWPVVEKEVPA